MILYLFGQVHARQGMRTSFCNTQHITTGLPNACNMLCPTILPYVVAKCCNILAGLCKCCFNNVAICYLLNCCDHLAGALCGDMHFLQTLTPGLTKDSHLFTILVQITCKLNLFVL